MSRAAVTQRPAVAKRDPCLVGSPARSVLAGREASPEGPLAAAASAWPRYAANTTVRDAYNSALALNPSEWAKLHIRGSLGIRGATDRITSEGGRLLGGGRTRGFLPYLGMCIDAADGVLALDRGGAIDVLWRAETSAMAFRQLEDGLKE